MRVRSSPITSAVGAIVLALAVFALRAQWRVYGAVGAVIFFVLFLVLLSLDNRHRPEFERVERTVKRHGRTEVHWEEHSYGTTILVEGAARISATGRLEATGEVQRRFPVACTYNENVWWLILDMPDSEVAVFRVKVTDPLGAEARKEFAEAGVRIVVRYPTDFRLGSRIDSVKHPWGKYWVTWEVYRFTADRKNLELHGTASCEFDWKPED